MSNKENQLLVKEMLKDLRSDVTRKLNELIKDNSETSIELLFRNAANIVLQEYAPKSQCNRIAYGV